jgi:hypothetical protein
MPNTFELIASSTVGSGGASSIVFNSIPGTFTDLVIKSSLRGDRAGSPNQAITINFNGLTTNLTERWLRLVDGAVGSGTEGSSIQWGAPGAGSTSSTFSNDEIYIPNYAGSTNKSVSIDNVSENNATNVFTYLAAGLWSDSSAITSISINAASAGTNLVQHSTAYLYGVKNA